ncbi:MAG TPA: glycosyltransferase family 2 protein [Pyrinomonadaceae bacterium]
MSIVFYIFAGLLIYFSFRSFQGGIAYLEFFREQLATEPSEYSPFATVIAPCKGVDEGLGENLSALLELDYREYEVIFVVDDENDPAVSVINEFKQDRQDGIESSGKHPLYPVHLVKLTVARRSTDSSQKVENIRAAVIQADPRSEVFVFVDSDVRPNKCWLQDLVAPLRDERVGATTGYRWFLSEQMTLASELRSAWNASIASALGPNVKSNFCWGGSMAIRRNTWERLDLAKRLKGTLSDDLTVTRAMKEAGLDIRFVARALTPSIENCTWREMLEFTTRQMKITRVYAQHLWLVSFFGSGLFTSVMLAAILVVVFSEQNTLLVWAALVTLAAVTVFSVGKAWLRLKAVEMVIPAARRQRFTQLTLWLLTPPIFLYNCQCALFSRTMTWRGIRYRLVSHERTERLSP